MFIPQTIERCKTKGCWSVALLHTESGRTYWLDASLDEKYADINIEWNQYIFYLTDIEDLARKEFQEDCDNFDDACSAVLEVLESEREVFHGEDGDWYIPEWKGVQLWNITK